MYTSDPGRLTPRLCCPPLQVAPLTLCGSFIWCCPCLCIPPLCACTSVPRYLYLTPSEPFYLCTSVPLYLATSLPRYLATSLYLCTSSYISVPLCGRRPGTIHVRPTPSPPTMMMPPPLLNHYSPGGYQAMYGLHPHPHHPPR